MRTDSKERIMPNSKLYCISCSSIEKRTPYIIAVNKETGYWEIESHSGSVKYSGNSNLELSNHINLSNYVYNLVDLYIGENLKAINRI